MKWLRGQKWVGSDRDWLRSSVSTSAAKLMFVAINELVGTQLGLNIDFFTDRTGQGQILSCSVWTSCFQFSIWLPVYVVVALLIWYHTNSFPSMTAALRVMQRRLMGSQTFDKQTKTSLLRANLASICIPQRAT